MQIIRLCHNVNPPIM